MNEIDYCDGYYIYLSEGRYYIEQDEDLGFASLDEARAKAHADPYARQILVEETNYEADHWKPIGRHTYKN